MRFNMFTCKLWCVNVKKLASVKIILKADATKIATDFCHGELNIMRLYWLCINLCPQQLLDLNDAFSHTITV